MDITNSQAVIDANKKAGYSAEKTDAGSKLDADFNFFLKLLTTQLQHQDPSEPMDTAQMTQQIATFSGVEQQVQTNTNLEELIASNVATSQQSQLAAASNYIGREIETAGNTGQVLGGQGAFSYILPEKANSVEITIKNASGATVFTGSGTLDAGRNVLLWDGKNSSTGAQEPDGIYSMSISSKNVKNEPMAGVETRAVGIVSGFEKDSKGNVVLNVGNGTVALEDVLTVRPATRANFEDAA